MDGSLADFAGRGSSVPAAPAVAGGAGEVYSDPLLQREGTYAARVQGQGTTASLPATQGAQAVSITAGAWARCLSGCSAPAASVLSLSGNDGAAVSLALLPFDMSSPSALVVPALHLREAQLLNSTVEAAEAALNASQWRLYRITLGEGLVRVYAGGALLVRSAAAPGTLASAGSGANVTLSWGQTWQDAHYLIDDLRVYYGPAGDAFWLSAAPVGASLHWLTVQAGAGPSAGTVDTLALAVVSPSGGLCSNATVEGLPAGGAAELPIVCEGSALVPRAVRGWLWGAGDDVHLLEVGLRGEVWETAPRRGPERAATWLADEPLRWAAPGAPPSGSTGPQATAACAVDSSGWAPALLLRADPLSLPATQLATPVTEPRISPSPGDVNVTMPSTLAVSSEAGAGPGGGAALRAEPGAAGGSIAVWAGRATLRRAAWWVRLDALPDPVPPSWSWNETRWGAWNGAGWRGTGSEAGLSAGIAFVHAAAGAITVAARGGRWALAATNGSIASAETLGGDFVIPGRWQEVELEIPGGMHAARGPGDAPFARVWSDGELAIPAAPVSHLATFLARIEIAAPGGAAGALFDGVRLCSEDCGPFRGWDLRNLWRPLSAPPPPLPPASLAVVPGCAGAASGQTVWRVRCGGAAVYLTGVPDAAFLSAGTPVGAAVPRCAADEAFTTDVRSGGACVLVADGVATRIAGGAVVLSRTSPGLRCGAAGAPVLEVALSRRCGRGAHCAGHGAPVEDADGACACRCDPGWGGGACEVRAVGDVARALASVATFDFPEPGDAAVRAGSGLVRRPRLCPAEQRRRACNGDVLTNVTACKPPYLDICSNTTGCVAIEHVHETGQCRLYAAPIDPVGSAGTDCHVIDSAEACRVSCTSLRCPSRSWHATVGLGVAPSAAACRVACTQHPRCRLWWFSPALRECRLLRRDVGGTEAEGVGGARADPGGEVAAPALPRGGSCARGSGCIEGGPARIPADLSAIGRVLTVALWVMLASGGGEERDDPDEAATYSPGGARRAALWELSPRRGAPGGPYGWRCRWGSRLEDAALVLPASHAAVGLGRPGSELGCRQRCEAHPYCSAWTFDATAGSCTGGTAGSPVPASGAVSSSLAAACVWGGALPGRDCVWEERGAHEHGEPGGEGDADAFAPGGWALWLGWVDDDRELCRHRCARHPECVAWTHRSAAHPTLKWAGSCIGVRSAADAALRVPRPRPWPAPAAEHAYAATASSCGLDPSGGGAALQLVGSGCCEHDGVGPWLRLWSLPAAAASPRDCLARCAGDPDCSSVELWSGGNGTCTAYAAAPSAAGCGGGNATSLRRCHARPDAMAVGEPPTSRLGWGRCANSAGGELSDLWCESELGLARCAAQCAADPDCRAFSHSSASPGACCAHSEAALGTVSYGLAAACYHPGSDWGEPQEGLRVDAGLDSTVRASASSPAGWRTPAGGLTLPTGRWARVALVVDREFWRLWVGDAVAGADSSAPLAVPPDSRLVVGGGHAGAAARWWGRVDEVILSRRYLPPGALEAAARPAPGGWHPLLRLRTRPLLQRPAQAGLACAHAWAPPGQGLPTLSASPPGALRQVSGETVALDAGGEAASAAAAAGVASPLEASFWLRRRGGSGCVSVGFLRNATDPGSAVLAADCPAGPGWRLGDGAGCDAALSARMSTASAGRWSRVVVRYRHRPASADLLVDGVEVCRGAPLRGAAASGADYADLADSLVIRAARGALAELGAMAVCVDPARAAPRPPPAPLELTELGPGGDLAALPLLRPLLQTGAVSYRLTCAGWNQGQRLLLWGLPADALADPSSAAASGGLQCATESVGEPNASAAGYGCLSQWGGFGLAGRHWRVGSRGGGTFIECGAGGNATPPDAASGAIEWRFGRPLAEELQRPLPPAPTAADAAALAERIECSNGGWDPADGACRCSFDPAGGYWQGARCDRCAPGWWGPRCSQALTCAEAQWLAPDDLRCWDRPGGEGTEPRRGACAWQGVVSRLGTDALSCLQL